MLYLTTERVFENFGMGELPGFTPPDCRAASKACQRHLETRAAKSGISSKAINETLLIFANFFMVNAYHTHCRRKDFFQRGTSSVIFQG